MKSYTDIRAETAEKLAEPHIDYSCRAHGCPNAGSLFGGDGSGNGLCYWHWMEHDQLKWAAVTHRIRGNFEKMRNF